MSLSLDLACATLSVSVPFAGAKLPIFLAGTRSGRQFGWFRPRPSYQFVSTRLTDFVTEHGAGLFQALHR
jgi:hypothetical protein